MRARCRRLGHDGRGGGRLRRGRQRHVHTGEGSADRQSQQKAEPGPDEDSAADHPAPRDVAEPLQPPGNGSTSHRRGGARPRAPPVERAPSQQLRRLAATQVLTRPRLQLSESRRLVHVRRPCAYTRVHAAQTVECCPLEGAQVAPSSWTSTPRLETLNRPSDRFHPRVSLRRCCRRIAPFSDVRLHVMSRTTAPQSAAPKHTVCGDRLTPRRQRNVAVSDRDPGFGTRALASALARRHRIH